MKIQERILNVLFGLSLIYWSLAGLCKYYDGIHTSSIRIFITLLNGMVGFLIIFRKPIIKKGSLNSILISLPSLICGGLLFKLSKSPLDWNLFSTVLFFAGGLTTLVAFISLGNSFSIFPGVRQVVSGGFYRLIRHPAYLGEFMMSLACLVAYNTYYSYPVFIVLIPALVLRIKEEEKLLFEDNNYQAYSNTVKWRLIAYLW